MSGSAEIPQKSPEEIAFEEELERRTLRGVYPNDMVLVMRGIAGQMRASFRVLAGEGQEYAVPESIEPLIVRENNTYIQIRVRTPNQFDTFWERVDKIYNYEVVK